MPAPSIPAPTARTVLLSIAAAVLAGCASMKAADARRDYFLKEAGTFTYAKACLDVWPDVLQLLGSKGYPLEGRDRQYAGQGKQSVFGEVVSGGSQTEAVQGGGLVVWTGWVAGTEGRSRYQVTGDPSPGGGCGVTFTRIYTTTIDPSDDERQTDWKIQLELLRKLEPNAAARLEAGAPAGG